ncbi:hypothetical protein AAC387_Pa02g3785 [Persea americana]
MENKNKEVIHMEPESVVSVQKPKLIKKLTELIEDSNQRFEFLKFCKGVEYTIRAWYHLQFEDLMQLYTIFNPLLADKKRQHSPDEMKRQQSLPPDEIKHLEQNFLTCLFEIIEKSNFKMLTDKEYKEALSGQYLVNFPILVDKEKLDSELFQSYFSQHRNRYSNLPKYNEDKYIIFRRGIGEESTSDYFYMAKLDMIISRLWTWFLCVTGLKWILSESLVRYKEKDSKKTDETTEDTKKEVKTIRVVKDLKKTDEINAEMAQDIERIPIQNVKLSIPNLFGKITIKEPTFDRMIVVYRRKEEQGIYVQHFKNIPMADMELVLPEKKNPSLTPMDWVQFLGSAVIGLAALGSSIEKPKADIWVFIALVMALVGYCAKIYFTFQQNMATYQNLITQAMYEKQLDSGKGTLLHLCDDVIQQEVKEVIIAFFILMKGKLSVKELDKQCEDFIKREFKETCNFEVEDAVDKLEKLKIIVRDPQGKIAGVELKVANEIIGLTTEERVLKAKQDVAN